MDAERLDPHPELELRELHRIVLLGHVVEGVRPIRERARAVSDGEPLDAEGGLPGDGVAAPEVVEHVDAGSGRRLPPGRLGEDPEQRGVHPEHGVGT